MKFLIQTINSEIQFDFQWELIQAIKGTNWFRNEIIYEYVLSDIDIPNCIPIGSVEFVSNYMKKYYDKEIIPLNIPDVLMKDKYLKRDCKILNKVDINITNPTFIKSINTIKGLTDIINKNIEYKEDQYFVSEVINIDSEWRSFIYNRELVGLQNYSGDFTLFPDVKLIKEMIRDYKNSPLAYTLDVGINNDDGTFIIELHNFTSCGLYGWSNHKLLPSMFTNWFRECIE